MAPPTTNSANSVVGITISSPTKVAEPSSTISELGAPQGPSTNRVAMIYIGREKPLTPAVQNEGKTLLNQAASLLAAAGSEIRAGIKATGEFYDSNVAPVVAPIVDPIKAEFKKISDSVSSIIPKMEDRPLFHGREAEAAYLSGLDPKTGEPLKK